MLEICVSLRRAQGTGAIDGATKATRLSGDILCVKTQPAVWGNDEKKYFLITFLSDPDLEAAMISNVLAYPYALTKPVSVGWDLVDEVLVEQFRETITTRSKYRVDLDMFTGSSGLDPEDTTAEPVAPNSKANLEVSDLLLDESDRTI